MGRRGRRRANPPYLLGAIAVLFLASLAAAAVLRSTVAAVEPGRCDPAWRGAANVIVVDASNQLAARHEATVRQAVSEAVSGRRDGRVIVVRVSGEQAYRPEILFDGCDPGGADQAGPMEGPASRAAIRQETFLDPLENELRTLIAPVRENRQSYLADTVMRLVADPAMHLDDGSTLIVISDLLENTVRSRPYSGQPIVLPEIRERFLSGIAVKLIELPAMPGATALQTFEMRDTWRRWFDRSGTPRLTMLSPGLDRRGR